MVNITLRDVELVADDGYRSGQGWPPGAEGLESHVGGQIRHVSESYAIVNKSRYGLEPGLQVMVGVTVFKLAP